jgi:hypothetical protein
MAFDKQIMDEFVEQAVAKNAKLGHNRNAGGAHRIYNNSFDGSVWIHARPRLGVFTIETTGEVQGVLDNELTRRFGPHLAENSKGYKLWHIETRNDLEDILQFWSKL